MTATALHLHGDGRDTEIDLDRWNSREIPHDELLWIDLMAPSDREIEAVQRAVGLSADGVEALREEPEQPDAVVLPGCVSVVVHTPTEDLETKPIGLRILMGEEWVVTVHPQPIPMLDEHRDRVRDERGVGVLTPVQFLVAILDWHVDLFFRIAARLETEVDVLDDAALRTERDLLQRLVDMRRQIARARRHLWSHREVVAELARPDFMPDLDEREAQALAALVQRLDRAADAIANAREMLIGTFDVHMTRTAQRTNDIMKILTLASAILLPASVIAGIMGMNFRIGFFDDPGMFWVVVVTMLGIAVGTIVLARVRGWL